MRQRHADPYWEGKIARGGQDAAVKGELLADRYVLHKRVGRGGMGAVWLASDGARDPHSPDGRVAVKILKPELAEDPDYVKRFRREARTLERLDHPNIVRAFDSGSDGERHFIVMEYLDGRNGAKLIEEAAPLEPAVAAEIVSQACEGLACVHGEKVVHRDVKPANLMIVGGPGEEGSLSVKLTDFGIARGDGDTSITGAQEVLGTLVYLAPECLIHGEEATTASDLYSLGVMLYELLTGSRPYDARSVGDLIPLLQHPPAPPGKRAGGIPGGLSAATMCALESNPGARLEDARTMRQAVLDGAAGKDISGLLPTRVQTGQTGFTDLMSGASGRRARARRARRQAGPQPTSEPPIDWGDILKMILVVLAGMVGIVVVIRSIAVLSALPGPLLVCLLALSLVAIMVARSPTGRRQVAGAASAVWLAIRPLEDEELTNLRQQDDSRRRFRVTAMRLARLLVFAGLIVCWAVLTFHLRDNMEGEIGRLPSAQHLPFEIAAVAIWLLGGLVPLAWIALSRANPGRILVVTLILPFAWLVGAEALPEAPPTLAPLIWPDTRREAIEERVSAESGRWKELLHRPYARLARGLSPGQIMQGVRQNAHERTGALQRASERSETIRAKRAARHWVSRMRRERRHWHLPHCRRHPGHVYVSLRRWGVAVACR